MNLENYRKVLEQIERHPETWDQTLWHCGTKHCIAGWAQILSGHPQDAALARLQARVFLDITFAEACYLFSSERKLSELQACKHAGVRSDAPWFGIPGFDKYGFDSDGLDRNNKPRETT